MLEKMKKVVLLGPQASGKSTQAKVITDFLNIPLIAASQALRKVVAKDSSLGRKIKEKMDQGLLVPDNQMITLILGELGRDHCRNGFLLDGFPRNLNQGQALESSCGVEKVFNIEISDQEAMRRILGRRMCKNGHVFHLEYKPSEKGDVCDICAEELYQRDDDKEEVVKKRLAIYRDETSKLLDYYKKKDKLVVFDGQKDMADVSEDILNYLKSHVG
ncbi:MAG: nucleoside monophosphate kinase [Candidatus Komeilibacteria bacterium]|jgi:adenylate kinase|nr:nucleoside monophosphate kinase [Candidatus Komeilibacteria bacterium]MBT4448000.1 nucleoside monophosphate kinase [Candidatus Komeilibacteria bacterium]